MTGIELKKVFSLSIAITLWLFASPIHAMESPANGHPDLSKVDKHALLTPASVEGSLPELASYLTKPFSTDIEKSRAIYRWITDNVAYDTQSFFSNGFRNADMSAKNVLQDRKSVCDGYSRLFTSLAELAGLEAVKISGYAKGFGFSPGQKFEEGANHAWNAVKIKGEWKLLDSTWGAGYVDGGSKSFKKKFTDFYFLTSPDEFIYDHLPDEEEWQLLNNSLTGKEYEELVYLRPGFFMKGLKLESHHKAVIETGYEVTITLLAPANVLMNGKLTHKGRDLDNSLLFTQRDGEHYMVNALFPVPGEYELRLFAKVQGEKGNYDQVMVYRINALKGTDRRHPRYGDLFFSHGLRLDSHKDGRINTIERVDLTLLVPEGVLLMASIFQGEKALEKNHLFVEREGEKYKISALFPRPGDYKLRIFTKKKTNPGMYKWNMDYEVVVTKGTKERFPIFGDAFFSHHLELASHKNGTINTDERVSVILKSPDNILILATLQKGEKKLNKSLVFTSKEKGGYKIQVQFPGPGEYTLRIFTKEEAKKGNYDWAMDYKVKVKKGVSGKAGFPQVFTSYSLLGLTLLSPFNKHLKAGEKQEFKINAPGTEKLFVTSGGERYYLKKNGDMFNGEVMIHKGEVRLWGETSGGKNWALLEYVGL